MVIPDNFLFYRCHKLLCMNKPVNLNSWSIAANLQSKAFNVKLVSARAVSVLPVVTTPHGPPTSAAYLCGLAAFGQIKEPMRSLAGDAQKRRVFSLRDAGAHRFIMMIVLPAPNIIAISF